MNKYDDDEKQRRPFVHFPKKMPEGNQDAPFGLISLGKYQPVQQPCNG
jgi:hypothetical protein